MRLGSSLFLSGAAVGGLYWLVRYFRPAHSTLVLNEKVVVITGASSGIGRALAYAFARRAARVILVARRKDRLEAVRREIEPYSTDALVIPADLTDEDQLRHVVDQTIATFGRLDILVNNAGMMPSGPLQDQTPEHMEQALRLNLWSKLRLIQLALPHMLERNQGYILNVGSGLGRTAMPMFVPYVAAKYGLAGASDALRRELDGTGIRVTLVLPTWTRTEMLDPEAEQLLARYGFRVDDPDAVAERAVLALVRGENEVILGGFLEWVGILCERYAPFLVNLYWKLWMTSEWVATMRRAYHNNH